MPAVRVPTIPLPTALRARLGAALQKHRLRRGLTQSQVAEAAGLSLKYVGEIERGEANTTLEALERLADAVSWDPMESLIGVREPITEGVRVLLLDELRQTGTRFDEMTKWLTALNPTLQQSTPTKPVTATRGRARPHRRRRLKGGAR